MQTKLIAIDLDGTLLTDDHRISTRSSQAIGKLLDKGVKVILASGRGPKSCDPFIQELQLSDAIITHNGAVIYAADPPRIMAQIGLDAANLLPAMEYCRQHHIHFDLNTAFDIFVEHMPAGARAIYERYFVNPKIITDASRVEEKIVKFTMAAEEKRLDAVLQDITPLFPEWRIIRSGETFIDIIHPEATKGHALTTLLQAFAIEPQHVVAFGNFYNDLDMIRMAGLGVAMDNAPMEVKEEADRVTASNNEDGVALVLEEIVEKNEA